jgi:hypothetical protein
MRIDGGDALDDAGHTLSDAGEPLPDTRGLSTDAVASSTDAGGPPVGLSTPCAAGPGWSLLRWHYASSAGSNPIIDVWDASCSYSYADQACNVVAVWSETMVHEGYAIQLAGNGYLRARFSVAGLSFSRASVHVQARSYATSSSTTFYLWSPIYGEVEGPLVDNDWVFDWYGVDWSEHLAPDDDPGLTAFQLYAGEGSNSLAVHAVELCVEE